MNRAARGQLNLKGLAGAGQHLIRKLIYVRGRGLCEVADSWREKRAGISGKSRTSVAGLFFVRRQYEVLAGSDGAAVALLRLPPRSSKYYVWGGFQPEATVHVVADNRGGDGDRIGFSDDRYPRYRQRYAAGIVCNLGNIAGDGATVPNESNYRARH